MRYRLHHFAHQIPRCRNDVQHLLGDQNLARGKNQLLTAGWSGWDLFMVKCATEVRLISVKPPEFPPGITCPQCPGIPSGGFFT